MKNKKIAIFANGWSNEFLEMILEGVRKEAAKDNVDVFAFLTYIFFMDDEKYSKCQLNIFHLPNPKEFDGAIMLTNTFNIADEKERVIALFQREGVPMVTVEVGADNMAFLGTENYTGMHELSKHLVDVHGVRDVVFVSGIESNDENAIRKQALSDVLEEKGLKIRDTFIGNFSFVDTTNALNAWLDKGNKLPDAFVCANDQMAIAVQSVLFKRGYSVPEDAIVTGFDNVVQARNCVPLLATVTRDWDTLGENAYLELKNQIEIKNPTFEKIFPSRFIPSESCGCEPDAEIVRKRLDKIRNYYMLDAARSLEDFYYQALRISMAKVENEEEFYEAAKSVIGTHPYLGDNFCLCVEPSFLNMNDEDYPQRIRGYSNKMDVLYERRNGESIPPYSFSSRSIVPNYRKAPNESNLYVMTPLCNMGYTIGYLVIKNDLSMVYDLTLRKWLENMDSMFVTIRQYIFSQQNNRKLKEIYMTDFLTGMYNRTGCENVLFAYIEKAKERGQNAVLLFADIDCMKVINDKYGHLNGDLAIKVTADAMKKSLSDEWIFGRYGGDEFVAVGPCPNVDNVPLLRENLFTSIKSIITTTSLAFNLSVSVGCTVITPDDCGEIADYIQRADDSMYEEKEKAHQRIYGQE